MNNTPSWFEAIFNAIQNKCPCCETGEIFGSFLQMHPKCPSCGITFERESGYFLGAMSFSYIIAFVLILPVFLPLLLGDYPLWMIVGMPSAEALILSPLMFRFSRLIWIHLDRRLNPLDEHVNTDR